jgi:hypothetical protein
MPMLRTAGITIAILLASASARADEISDEEAECRDKTAGAACSKGTCQESECSRIDYSGDKPESVKRSCMMCVAGPAKAEAPAKTDAPAKAEPAPTKSSCAVEPGPLSLGTIPLGIVLVALARRRSPRA